MWKTGSTVPLTSCDADDTLGVPVVPAFWEGGFNFQIIVFNSIVTAVNSRFGHVVQLLQFGPALIQRTLLKYVEWNAFLLYLDAFDLPLGPKNVGTVRGLYKSALKSCNLGDLSA